MDTVSNQRRPPVGPRETAFRFGAHELRPGRQLLRDGAAVPIGRIALELLATLVRARGDLVTKDELFAAAWPGLVVVENALHQHMRALRGALGDDSGLIVTVLAMAHLGSSYSAKALMAWLSAGAESSEDDMVALVPSHTRRSRRLTAATAVRSAAARRCAVAALRC